MKKQLLTLILAIISLSSYAQWINQNVPLPYTGYINSMNAIDANIVWGNPWDATATSAYTRDFVRTIDGYTWTFGTITSAPTSYSVSNIWPLNADTAFAAMWNDPWGGGVFRTYDGGTSWSQVGTNMFTTPNASFTNIVYFWNDMDGLAAGDPIGSPEKYEIWLTNDGGDTWTQVPGASLPTLTNNDEFGITNLFDAQQGYFWFGTTYGDVYRSTDMGQTWTKTATGLPPYTSGGQRFDITDIAFSDSLNGLVLQVNATGYELMQTTDGGLTWSNVTPIGTFYFNDIEGIPETNYFVSAGSSAASGFGTSISYDGGINWVDLDMNTSHTSLSFVDENTGFSGEFINSGSPGGAWKYVDCSSIYINPGILTPNNSSLCPNDTLILIPSGVTAPTTGQGNGFAALLSTTDISGSIDPLNEPGFLAGTNVLSTLLPITLIYDNSFLPGNYYITPLVIGNGTGAGPNITQYTLDLSCTHTGNSVMITLLPANDPACIVGINETIAEQFILNSFFPNENLLSVNINSAVNEIAVLAVYDITGRIVYNNNINLVYGSNSHKIDVKNLRPGAYFIKVNTTNYKAVNKLVKF